MKLPEGFQPTRLVLKETVLQGFISRVAASSFKQQLVLLQTQKGTNDGLQPYRLSW